MQAKHEILHVFVPTGALVCGTRMQIDVRSPHEACVFLSACHTPFRIRVGNAEQTLTAAFAPYPPRRTLDARGARALAFRITPLHPLFRRLHATQDMLVLDRTTFDDLDEAMLEASHGRLPVSQAKQLFEQVVERTASLLPACPPSDARVIQAIKLARTMDPEPSLADLAEALGMSPSRLSHLWTEHVGMPLRSFTTWRRTVRAGALLVNTSMAITEIAYRMGFSDSAHFARTFHHYTGQTPSEMRDGKTVVLSSLGPAGTDTN